jgi:hypothetical protein
MFAHTIATTPKAETSMAFKIVKNMDHLDMRLILANRGNFLREVLEATFSVLRLGGSGTQL